MRENEQLKKEKEIKALATSYSLDRHHLMANTQTSYQKELQENFEIDKDLGLENQMRIDQTELIQKDIDELTNSRDYYEVRKSTLKKIFGISRLKMMCLPFNIREISFKLFKYFWRPTLYFLIALGTLIYTTNTWYNLHNNWSPTLNNVYIILSVVLSCAITIYALCKLFFIDTYTRSMTTIRDDHHETSYVRTYDLIDVDLIIEPLNKTRLKIPYSAKLKTKEALETDIFNDFVIAYPKFVQKKVEEEFIVSKPVERWLDPAILGVTQDNRMFFIVSWDLENDTKRVERSIKKFKKYKVK